MSTVVAEFSGERSGTAPLTWGQINMVRATADNLPGYFNLSRVITPPRRAALDPTGAAEVIARLMRRHESLRTLFEAGPPERQRVLGEGRLAIEQVPADGDPDLAAERLSTRLVKPPFDDDAELPLRAGLVTEGGQVRRVVLALSHLAADGAAMDLLEREFRLLALRGDIGTDPGPQPRELAAREQANGRRLTEAAVSHWKSVYLRMPWTMFDRERPAHEPLCRQLVMTSPALVPATRLLAASYRVSTATVLLAATAAMVGRWTGHELVTITTLVSNRFQAGHERIVTTLVQQGLFALEMQGETFPDLIPRAHQAAMRAYRHAYFDPDAMRAALDPVSEERGVLVDPRCCFNDLRIDPDTVTGGPVDPAALRAAASAALPDTTTTWLDPVSWMYCRFCLQVLDAPGALALKLTADTRHLPPDDMERFLRETERMVLEAAGCAVPV